MTFSILSLGEEKRVLPTSLIRNVQWFPQGDRKLFIIGVEPNEILVIMDKNGNKKEIAMGVVESVISPDGKKIAYISRKDGLWIVNSDGSNQVHLLNERGIDIIWSPSSDELLYVLPQKERTLLYSIDIKTKERILLHEEMFPKR